MALLEQHLVSQVEDHPQHRHSEIAVEVSEVLVRQRSGCQGGSRTEHRYRLCFFFLFVTLHCDQLVDLLRICESISRFTKAFLFLGEWELNTHAIVVERVCTSIQCRNSFCLSLILSLRIARTVL